LAEEIYDKCGSKKGEFLRMNRGEFNPSLMNANPDELLTQLKQMIAQDPNGALAFAEALSK
jgi:hypothetical protein